MVIEKFTPFIQVYIFFVTSRGILVEEIPETVNRRRFGNSCISMLHSIEMICDQYPAGFSIYSFIDNISVTLIRGYPIEVKINRETLIWLYGNTSGPMTRWSSGNISSYSSWGFIKYFRCSVAEIWYSVNIFVIIVELLITRMSKSLVP